MHPGAEGRMVSSSGQRVVEMGSRGEVGVQPHREGSWKGKERAHARDIGEPEGRVPETAPGGKREGQGGGRWGERCPGFDIGASEAPPPLTVPFLTPCRPSFQGLLALDSFPPPPSPTPALVYHLGLAPTQVPDQSGRGGREKGIGGVGSALHTERKRVSFQHKSTGSSSAAGLPHSRE